MRLPTRRQTKQPIPETSESLGGLNESVQADHDGSNAGSVIVNGHFKQSIKVDLEEGSPSKSKEAMVSLLLPPTVSVDLNPEKSNGENGGLDQSLLTSTSKTSSAMSQSSAKAITACINYSFCSVSMILVNKSLASSYNHLIDGDGLNVLLVVFQAIVAVVCVESCRISGIIENYPPLNYETAKSWAPVNLFFCGMLFTGMASLQTNSVPMVTVFKNITNILTTIGDYFWFGSVPEQLVIAAFGVMLGGAIAAAWKDITISSIGLFWMAMNCVSTAGYVLYMKHATQSIKMTKFGMVYANNVLCIAFLLPISYMLGEVDLFNKTNAIHTMDYAMKNLFAGFIGFFLNFASLSCVQATGPTTYAIVGSLNKVPVTFLGYFVFDSTITNETLFYIGVSLCGGFLYSYAKIQSSRGRSHAS